MDMRAIVFCPAISANPIYETLKYLDEDEIIMDYSDEKLFDEIEKEKEEIEYLNKYVVVWKRYLKIDGSINLLLPDELLILSKYDFKETHEIPHPPYKYPRINFLCFDDLVGDPQAFRNGHSAINNLIIRHRYLHCNFLFTTQYLKAIPPVIRRN